MTDNLSTVEWIATPDPITNPYDPVNRPQHYAFSFNLLNIQAEIASTYPLRAAFMIWNVLKYVARASRKGKPVEDLQKAEFYLKRAIEIVSEKPASMASNRMNMEGSFDCS